jgi:hypothetical protein
MTRHLTFAREWKNLNLTIQRMIDGVDLQAKDQTSVELRAPQRRTFCLPKLSSLNTFLGPLRMLLNQRPSLKGEAENSRHHNCAVVV